MVGLAAELNVVLDAELADAGVADVMHHEWDAYSADVNDVLDRMEALVAAASPESTLAEYVADHGLDEMFPLVADRLGLPLAHDGDGMLGPYLSQMSLFHSLLTLADQLEADLGLADHRYYAHQIALLYSLLVQAGLKGSRFKKKVESIFDDVKTITETQDAPRLTPELCTIIRELASDVRETLGRFPSKISRKVAPLREYVAAHRA